MAEAERIRQWREQLAEEADSDDDGGFAPPGGLGGGHSLFGPPPDSRPQSVHDNDMGLGLREPAPSRLHGVGVTAREPPRRSSQGPSSGTLIPPRGGVLPSGAERELVLQHKLQVLQLQLEEREIELEHARSLAAPAATGRAVGSDPRDDKFKELAKRSKAATMALGKERAKAAQLAADLAAAKKELEKAAVPAGGAGDAGAVGASELKEAKSQLAANNAKLHEQKVAAQALRAELQRYQRALAKEVGDDALVSKLLEEGSGAKGRAQQIALLKVRAPHARAPPPLPTHTPTHSLPHTHTPSGPQNHQPASQLPRAPSEWPPLPP